MPTNLSWRGKSPNSEIWDGQSNGCHSCDQEPIQTLAKVREHSLPHVNILKLEASTVPRNWEIRAAKFEWALGCFYLLFYFKIWVVKFEQPQQKYKFNDLNAGRRKYRTEVYFIVIFDQRSFRYYLNSCHHLKLFTCQPSFICEEH